MRVTFTETALEQYMGWQKEDKKTLKRINALIRDIQTRDIQTFDKNIHPCYIFYRYEYNFQNSTKIRSL